MKRLLLPALVLAATTVFAADTNTLTVQATVLGTCKFSTGNSTLNFGNMDPSSGSATSASTTTQFWCTKGVGGETVTADTGLHFAGTNRNLLGPNNDVIPYSLTLNKDGSANAGPAAPRTLTVNGSIAFADYADKSAGAYNDTVVLTINP